MPLFELDEEALAAGQPLLSLLSGDELDLADDFGFPSSILDHPADGALGHTASQRVQLSPPRSAFLVLLQWTGSLLAPLQKAQR